MKRTAILPTGQPQFLAFKALRALRLGYLEHLCKKPQPALATLATSTRLAPDITMGSGRDREAAPGAECLLQIRLEDWNLLFQSLQSRLASAAGEASTSNPLSAPEEAAVQLRLVALECVADLDYLRTAVKPAQR